MTRDELEHILRAASRIADDRNVIVVGSQAILGSFDDQDLPDEAIGSIEADICFTDDTENLKSDLVDGAIGELSAFHASFGIYAQGVGIETAVLPSDWRDRVAVLDSPGTSPGRGLCLEPHDLVASKLAAGREKDFDFARALLRHDLVDADTIADRVGKLAIPHDQRDQLLTWVSANGGRT